MKNLLFVQRCRYMHKINLHPFIEHILHFLSVSFAHFAAAFTSLTHYSFRLMSIVSLNKAPLSALLTLTSLSSSASSSLIEFSFDRKLCFRWGAACCWYWLVPACSKHPAAQLLKNVMLLLGWCIGNKRRKMTDCLMGGFGYIMVARNK